MAMTYAEAQPFIIGFLIGLVVLLWIQTLILQKRLCALWEWSCSEIADLRYLISYRGEIIPPQGGSGTAPAKGA